jgi:hypothetical protein
MVRAADILRRLILAVAVLALAALIVFVYARRRLAREEPAPSFASGQEHFLYGSIGSEADGLPYWVWLVLPRVFPEYLPGPGGYSSLGFDTREGRDMPVGLSKVVTGGVPRVGINCAFCHTARVRLRAGDISTIVPAAPGHQINWDRYRRFLVACASDPRFTSDTLLAEIDRNYSLPPFERMLYKFAVIPRARRALLQLQPGGDARELGAGRSPAFGVGTLPHASGMDPFRGAADAMPLWGLGRPRQAFYWDGMNTTLAEAINAWALASGSSPGWLDREAAGIDGAGSTSSLSRIRQYLTEATPPKFPLPIDAALAKSGEAVFGAECGSCHAPGGPRTGAVVPYEQVGTDRARLDAWAADAATAYNAAFAGKSWAFSSFTKTAGFVSPSLDGLWLRAPYLHNGSVPSLADLLNPQEQRPKQFWRGYDLLDAAAVGFVSSGAEAERAGTLYDTSLPGNGNGGHLFGTALPPDRKRALIEYLKGL